MTEKGDRASPFFFAVLGERAADSTVAPRPLQVRSFAAFGLSNFGVERRGFEWVISVHERVPGPGQSPDTVSVDVAQLGYSK